MSYAQIVCGSLGIVLVFVSGMFTEEGEMQHAFISMAVAIACLGALVI